MLQHILPLIPEHKVYTESFFGGGAVFFAKQPALSEIINDSNALIMNFYQVLCNDFDKLKEKIEVSIFGRDTYKVAMVIWNMPHLFDKIQQAWAFYIGCNMGFSSMIGSWGMDKYGKRAKVFNNKKIKFVAGIGERLKKATIEHNDACKVIKLYDTEDAFHYVDPPYINSNCAHYSGYSQADYIKLLDTLSTVKGKFLLSSYPSEILDTYIKKNGWQTVRFSKTLNAQKGKLGQKRTGIKTEVLTANYPINDTDL